MSSGYACPEWRSRGQVHPYRKRGKPAIRPYLVNEDDNAVVATTGPSTGPITYYVLAADVWRLNRLRWVSLLKTLASA